jgi:hypothetical protein
MTTREEHLTWCKQRALEYVDRGNAVDAYASMASDMAEHAETKGHPAINLGMMLMMSGHLESPDKMREFINGFH